MATRKYNHTKFLGGKKDEISDKKVLPGMVVQFYYNSPKVFDRTPIAFILHTDENYHHGYNLRYLTENNIKLLLGKVFNFTSPIRENKVKAREPYVRALLSSKYTPSFVDGSFLYRNLKSYPKIIEAYRTYRLDRISNLELVPINYTYFGYVVEEDKGIL